MLLDQLGESFSELFSLRTRYVSKVRLLLGAIASRWGAGKK